MANIDVKLGIKAILTRIESAFARRSEVNNRTKLFQRATAEKPLILIGNQNEEANAGCCEQDEAHRTNR